MVGNRGIWIFGFLSILILSIPISPIFAMPISPGYDLFATTPAPFDFGGPIGTVVLKGVPIGPGDTDTIVQRMTGVPAGATGTIPIELVALSLKSVSPVNIGGSFFDIFVTINKLNLPNVYQPDVLPPSVGTVQIISHDDVTGGGTFNSFFDIFADVIVVPAGHNINDPNGQHFLAPQLHLGGLGDPWSHTPPQNYPTDPSFPSGSFFSGPISFNGIHPIVPAQVQSTTSIPEFPFSFSLVIMFVVVAAVYMGIRQKMIPNFKRF